MEVQSDHVIVARICLKTAYYVDSLSSLAQAGEAENAAELNFQRGLKNRGLHPLWPPFQLPASLN